MLHTKHLELCAELFTLLGQPWGLPALRHQLLEPVHLYTVGQGKKRQQCVTQHGLQLVQPSQNDPHEPFQDKRDHLLAHLVAVCAELRAKLRSAAAIGAASVPAQCQFPVTAASGPLHADELRHPAAAATGAIRALPGADGGARQVLGPLQDADLPELA